jgi:hypothetical protein
MSINVKKYVEGVGQKRGESKTERPQRGIEGGEKKWKV